MAKVKIKPIGDRVLVKHLEEKEQVRGGIIIPDSAKEKPQEAEVIALGTGKKDENGKLSTFEVKVGDKVLISKYGGTEVKIDESNTRSSVRTTSLACSFEPDFYQQNQLSENLLKNTCLLNNSSSTRQLVRKSSAASSCSPARSK